MMRGRKDFSIKIDKNKGGVAYGEVDEEVDEEKDDENRIICCKGISR